MVDYHETPEERYKCVKEACRVGDEIFQEVLNHFSSFRTERDVYLFILQKTHERGLRPAFPSIIANNQWIIHPRPRKKRLSRGFCVIDMGVRINRYCSDMTRTVFLGNPSKKEREMYKLIYDCQNKSCSKLSVGVNCKELDLYSRKLLGKYAKFYTHSLGHGVGKRIHQPPWLSPRKGAKYNIKEGDMVTIEPGIYLKGKYGIRIEDTIHVAKDGIEILTKSPKELICVDW